MLDARPLSSMNEWNGLKAAVRDFDYDWINPTISRMPASRIFWSNIVIFEN